MTEENNNTEAQATAPPPPPEKSGGLFKYIIIGIVGIVVVAGVSVVALVMMTGDRPEETSAAAEVTADQPAHHVEATPETSSKKDEKPQVTAEQIAADLNEGMADPSEDPSVLGDIMANLAFLEYEPEPEDLSGMEIGMSVEDSIEHMNWLDREKARLAQREKELAKREHEISSRRYELEQLEEDVNKKLLVLEQAKTARVTSLAKLYDGMDPRAVAQLTENLDDETVVALIPRMKTKNASALLSLMPPQRAARLSQKMITISEK